MPINFTFLKSSIVDSSIWNEDAETCKVWITLLAKRNRSGEIFGSIGGIAVAARINREKTKQAINKFLLPDEDSASRDDGRRLVEIPGGWKLLNHEKIQAEAAAASKNNYMADYMRKKRRKEKFFKFGTLEGQNEYLAAERAGATEEELDLIVIKYLPKKNEPKNTQ